MAEPIQVDYSACTPEQIAIDEAWIAEQVAIHLPRLRQRIEEGGFFLSSRRLAFDIETKEYGNGSGPTPRANKVFHRLRKELCPHAYPQDFGKGMLPTMHALEQFMPDYCTGMMTRAFNGRRMISYFSHEADMVMYRMMF